jgi:hypothetical protein
MIQNWGTNFMGSLQPIDQTQVGPTLPEVYSPGKIGRYNEPELQHFIEQLLMDGFCILRNHFDSNKLQAWREAFLKLMEERLGNGTASARGPNRYYISLPFTPPFADAAIYEDPDILFILERAAQGEIVMPELATDTPLKGSDYQVIHRDHVQHSPNLPDLSLATPFQFAVNFPLVDVTAENGPFEIIPGTHLLSDEEARQQIQSGESEQKLIPLMMSVGDVMIRDVRALHRGTPNRTDTPRPMVVVGYNRVEHLRPQLRILIPSTAKSQLSPRGMQLLRLNPVVDSLDDRVPEEAYSNLYFLEEN